MATPERVTLTDVRTVASEILSIMRDNQPTEAAAHRYASTATLFRQKVQAIDSQLEELDEEMRRLEEEMNRLRGKLRDVEQASDELKRQKAEYLQAILAIDSLVAPWRRLPRELMEEIFIHCLPYERNRRPSLKHAPFILTRVCRSWYQIVGDMPRMWSTIVLAIINCRDSLSAAALDAGIRYLELCIARSKDNPITLCIRAEFLSQFRSRNLINQISPRIVAFKIVYPEPRRSTPSFLSSSNTLVMPNLKTVEVQGWMWVLLSEGSRFVRMMKFSKHLECFISNVCLNVLESAPLTFSCWSKLQVLHLRGSVSFRLCLSILQSTPTLHTLSLYWQSPRDDDNDNLGSDSPIAGVDTASLFTHPNLRTLSVDYLNRFFNIVALPKLENLVLLGCGEGMGWSQLRDAFMAFLARSGCELKYFELRGDIITPCQVLELVKSKFFRRTLETLIVHSEEEVADSSLFEPLTIPQPGAVPTSEDLEGASSIICPNLQTLLLGFRLDQDSIRSLIDMIESRTRDFMRDGVRGGGGGGTAGRGLDRVGKSLKILGKISDWAPYENEELLSCCASRDVALMVTKFWRLPQPADEKQEALLRCRMAEGVELRFFDPIRGKWVSAIGDKLGY